ncbi:MAG: FtsX-like permease family protein [Candidatus Magasanikbacteria bacterium]|jgi:cell division transport system permease protein|nr:FtsX-like permease family protein [Candidatus Magasanikbacteria bacterium]MBT4315340.1 FtsX-like permease family protein [Candidatus Magasanikbacteria bacterium]MBT4547213.1 FtsX-like permease family protein [Candidatus Magasanikbacteria bacterium]MBT6819453.1 FtsX-like permease family protein [Candidatus Magasanikbacteria bacterium]
MMSFLRVIKFAFQDMVRNIGLSAMTVLILVLMLLSINTLVIINAITGEAVRTIKEQIDVSVYFNEESTPEEIEEIKSYVNSFPEVVEIKFFSEEEVLAGFREQHIDNPEIISALDELGENPLGSTMIIRTREPKDYEKVITALSVPEYETIIEAKTFGDTEKAIERIHVITTQVERFGVALSALFAFIAFLIIFNTIRVAIYTQRSEISIKKLVGASNWFVQGPYIIESFIFTIFSIAITGGLILLSLRFLDPYVEIVFGKTEMLATYYQTNFWLLLLIHFLSVLLLTVLSSILAMRKYLRV